MKRSLRDAGFDNQPHECEKVGDITFRCLSCQKMGELTEMIGHVVRNQETIRTIR